MRRRWLSDGEPRYVSPFVIGTNSVVIGLQFGISAWAKSGSTNKNTASGPHDQQ